MTPAPIYFIRSKQTWNLITDLPFLTENETVGYYIPQPIYKNWVPNWFIRFLLKK